MAALFLGAAASAAAAQEDPDAASPLTVVMDGRAAAATSNLTETGMTTLAQASANVILFVCGALAILLTALALWDYYRAQDMEGMHMEGEAKRAAISKLILAGFVSIPAIVAGVIPHILF
ncbi:MAG: hypothetical protein HC844_08445 [Tabrizicola sp.]|nr:hypothetical protein [Tabrizicola sp.]